MDEKTQHGYLVITDISGFTSYLAKAELQHAREILIDLLEIIVKEFNEVLTTSNDEIYVVVSGEVRVLVSSRENGDREVARRKVGETVGEMSVISDSLRSASLFAVGDVHMLCLDQKSFEGLLRERPEVGLAAMRMLYDRLRQVSQREDAQYD